MNKDELKVGDMVYVNNDYTKSYPIIRIDKDKDKYIIVIDNKLQQFYKNVITPKTKEKIELSYSKFCAYLSKSYLEQPKSNKLYSLNSANIDYIPYQFRPVLKLIKSDEHRLLIADDVGVGKTIEAGIILKELQTRNNIEKVLIICPRPLITEHKWKNEMKRFGEDFDELDGSSLEYCINYLDENGIWSNKYHKIIVPYSLFNQQLLEGKKNLIGLEQLDPKPQFDLVIVDEAHYIRNADSYRYKVVKFFCENAKAVIFLTATPIQMHNNDLYTLLNVLRPDVAINKDSFEYITKPNRFINQAVSAMRSQEENWQDIAYSALNDAQTTEYGQETLTNNPAIKRIKETLSLKEITREQRIEMISQTETLHTLSHIINRTRRREIGNFTQRNSQTVVSEYTNPQRELYKRVIDFIAEIIQLTHPTISVRFMMTTLMRQISSSLFALQPFLQDILSKKIKQLDWQGIEEWDTEKDIDITELNPYEKEIEKIINLSNCLKPDDDDKLQQLKKIIHQKQERDNNKIIIFSTFRHTLDYLLQELKSSGFRVGLINGDTPQDERYSLRSCFEKDREENDCLDILLFSEVGCEGLDYQFCDCLVNYDIPWNPMKIEQRIGRIDRKGQEAEKIAIYNFITQDTIDADIYERCLNRIGIFEQAIGETDEILGDIVQKINKIAADFTLTDKQRQKKLEEIADNEIKQQREQQKLEQDAAQLFGIELSQEQMEKEVEDARSFWLSPKALHNLIKLYLGENAILGNDSSKNILTLRLAEDKRSVLKNDFDKLYDNKPLNLEEMEWKKWLNGNEPLFPFTFKGEENQYATKKSHLISPQHPIIKQAIANLPQLDAIEEQPITYLEVSSDKVPAGDYIFAVYSWTYQGFRSDFQLKAISDDEQLSKCLEELLTQAQDNPNCNFVIDENSKDKLETQQKNLYDQALAKYKEEAEQDIAFKKEQLKQDADRRIKIYEKNIKEGKDEKYIKGEKTKISNLQQQTEEKLQQLERQLQLTALNTNPIAFGVITIKPSSL